MERKEPVKIVVLTEDEWSSFETITAWMFCTVYHNPYEGGVLMPAHVIKTVENPHYDTHKD